MIDVSVPTRGTSVARDPFSRVLQLGASGRRGAILRACFGAVLLHTLMAEWGLWRARRAEADAASDVQELSIEAVPELPEPVPEPVPPPEPEPKAPPQVVAVAPPELQAEPEEEPKDEPPSSEAAQAGEVLTQEDDEEDEDDDEEVTFVTGHADSYAGGMTAAGGTSALAVRGAIDPVGGVPGGTGTHAIAAPKPPSDKSRQAWLLGANWDCDFPGEADRDEINHAAVEIAVIVRPNGTPQEVKVLEDPGHGFARRACACALKHKFSPARDKDGNSIWGTTPPFHVGFHR